MKLSLGIALIISLSLASCTKHPITQVTVNGAEIFSGHIRLIPCIQGAQDPTALNESGGGNTTACPLGDVDIVVIKPSKTLNIAPENVHVRRRSDGNPSVIFAEIP
jgi:hypothetical protein